MTDFYDIRYRRYEDDKRDFYDLSPLYRTTTSYTHKELGRTLTHTHHKLHDEIKQWFVDQGVGEDGYSWNETLVVLMRIHDPQVAMLFKLTWL